MTDIEIMKKMIMNELDRLTEKDVDTLEISRSNAISNSILTYIRAENLIIRKNEVLWKEQNMMKNM